MTPDEIRELIEMEVSGRTIVNWHGVDLKRCLVAPVKKTYDNSFSEGTTLDLWLVLEEMPDDPKHGYKIIFDEEYGKFGLAITGIGNDVFIGYYGTFRDTLEGM